MHIVLLIVVLIVLASVKTIAELKSSLFCKAITEHSPFSTFAATICSINRDS